MKEILYFGIKFFTILCVCSVSVLLLVGGFLNLLAKIL